MRIKDVAQIFDVTTKTIRNWMDNGKIKAIKLGGQYRIPFVEVNRVLGESGGKVYLGKAIDPTIDMLASIGRTILETILTRLPNEQRTNENLSKAFTTVIKTVCSTLHSIIKDEYERTIASLVDFHLI